MVKYRVQTFLFGYSRQVERLEVCQCDMTRVSFVTLLDEVHHILVSGREGQILGKDRLDVLGGDDLAVTLVEETEALLGLLVLTWLRADTPIPVVSHHVLNEGKVHGGALEDLRVTFLELLLDITRAHSVEAEVLQDVLEEIVRNGVFALNQVMVKALLEISSHLTRQIANVLTLRRLGNILGYFFSSCLSVHIFFLF